jgi:predicted enzyme related to lactoylglutathione lyase
MAEGQKPKRVTGVGGVFFKCNDPEKVKSWYAKHLGFDTDEYGAAFVFKKKENPEKNGYLQWSPFSQKSEHFAPSKKDFMFNYRVENLVWLVDQLKKEGVEVIDEIEEFDYGKFVHIMDLEGNKIELWEPVDEVFDAYMEEKKKNI